MGPYTGLKSFLDRLQDARELIYVRTPIDARFEIWAMTQRYAHHYPESPRSSIEFLDVARREISTNKKGGYPWWIIP